MTAGPDTFRQFNDPSNREGIDQFSMHEKFTLIQKHDLEAPPSYFTARTLKIMFKFKIYKSGYVIIFFVQ